MKQNDRMLYIREGNKSFNEGEIELAKKYFLKADYQSGLLRVADYYYYDKKLPLNALPLYLKCGSKDRIDEIYQRMAFALGKMLEKDKIQDSPKDVKPSADGVQKEITQSLDQGTVQDKPAQTASQDVKAPDSQ
ncbi:MAG: hypothetical protein OEZ36_10760, partial [Spirochaetota bacterium]|nr:hypothetical protein [Spirochaetota bacterium]